MTSDRRPPRETGEGEPTLDLDERWGQGPDTAAPDDPGDPVVDEARRINSTPMGPEDRPAG